MGEPAPLILVVDDHDDSAEMYAFALAGLGFRVLTASSAAEAFGRVCSEQPDVVVIDIALGSGPTGLDLAEQLRRDGRCRAAKLLALTAHGSRDYRQRSLDAGCDAFLLKPCPADVLAAAIHHLIASATPGRQDR
jgi:two-component system cell cycle response regulator DivK